MELETTEISKADVINVSAETGRAQAPSQNARQSAQRSSRRLLLLLLTGLAVISVGLGVRNSSWARERHLRALTIEELSLAIHDNPRDALTWTFYGVALRKEGQLDASRKALQWAIKADPKMANTYLELGNVQMLTGEGEAAKQSFQEAIHLAPNDTRNYMALAKACYTLGSARQAIEPLKKLIALDPRNVYAWYTLGKMYGDSHQSDLSYEALTHAVRLDPKQALCWRDLAQVSRHYSHFAEAEQQFQKSLALDVKDSTTHYWLGQLYLEMGDTEAMRIQAQQHLETALQLTPGMAEAHFELGRLYERRRDYPQALLHFEKARALDPANDQALYHYGLALAQTGKKAEGEQYVAGAQELASARHDVEDTENQIRTDPQNRSLRLRLARFYRKYGNDQDAIVEYQTYQRMGSEDPVVAHEIIAYQKELLHHAKSSAPAAPRS